MPSIGVAVGIAPVDLDSAMSLAEGVEYALQNKSDYDLYLVLGAAEPTPGSDAASLVEQLVEPMKHFLYSPVDGEDLFAYYKRSGASGVVSGSET